MNIAVCLLLLIAANGAPVVATRLCGSRCAWRVDGGHNFFDGRPVLGSAKTWRGIFAAVLACAFAGQLLAVGWQTGAALGGLSMLGDLLSSFIKRRLGIAVSGRARLLDQVPESALPLLVLHESLGLTAYTETAMVVTVFVILDLSVSPLLYRLHIRKRPY